MSGQAAIRRLKADLPGNDGAFRSQPSPGKPRGSSQNGTNSVAILGKTLNIGASAWPLSFRNVDISFSNPSWAACAASMVAAFARAVGAATE